MGAQHFGIVGLGVMGENLAQNIERNGFSVAGYDLDAGKVDSFAKATTGKKAAAARSLEEFLGALAVPRRILMMVPAGKPVDAVIDSLRPHLQAGDVLIDGGNTYFADTVRRIAALPVKAISRPTGASSRWGFRPSKSDEIGETTAYAWIGQRTRPPSDPSKNCSGLFGLKTSAC